MALRGILPVVILWSSLIGLVLAQNPSNGTNGTVYSNVNETVSPVVASPASIVPSAAPTEATPMPTSAPFAVPPEQECYTNLTALNLIVRAKPAYEKKTYILCSNSVIQVGRLGPDGECCTGGVDPLWPRRDVTYQCGEDGSSANNCTLVGGAVHVLGFKYMFNNEPKTDAVFRGITFDAAYDISILMIAPGTYFFHDCIFKNNSNSGAVKLSYTPGDEEVRLLYGDGVVDGSHAYERESTKWHTFAESLASSLGGSDETDAIEQRPDSRQIQDSEEEYPTRHAMVFDNCLFIHNSAGTTNKDIHYGVIYAQTETIDLVVNNSLFVENVFVGENVVGDSFAISVTAGSTLELSNTCFINNNFVGRGAVLVENADEITESGNWGTTTDTEVDCQFIAVGADSCIPYSSETCRAEKYASLPTSMPASTSSSIPAPAPTNNDTNTGSSAFSLSFSMWRLSVVPILVALAVA